VHSLKKVHRDVCLLILRPIYLREFPTVRNFSPLHSATKLLCLLSSNRLEASQQGFWISWIFGLILPLRIIKYIVLTDNVEKKMKLFGRELATRLFSWVLTVSHLFSLPINYSLCPPCNLYSPLLRDLRHCCIDLSCHSLLSVRYMMFPPNCYGWC
jgi:hypothetical protein